MTAGRTIGRTTTSSYRFGVRARNKLFSLLAAGAFESFGARSVVQLPVRLQGEGRIAIGSGVFVGAGCWLQVLEGESEGVALTLEDHVALAGYCVLSAARSIRLSTRIRRCSANRSSTTRARARYPSCTARRSWACRRDRSAARCARRCRFATRTGT